METAFTPVASLTGGALIGLSAVLLMLFYGRIAGMTGMLTGLFLAKDMSDRMLRILLLAGAALAPVLWYLADGSMPAITVEADRLAIIAGGLVTGIGVALANGCTSGHGVCGLARLSPRSLVATLTFMLTCGLTVFVLRHVL